MSNKLPSKQPFEPLGRKLKKLRVSRQESLAEVSGAVEIQIAQLEEIESGKNRPAEEILELLIRHFSLADVEADSLWKLAGYNNTSPKLDNQSVVMVTPEDLKIVYTDMVHISVNNYGVVMNFMQGGGPNTQPLAIARVGMSKEHAVSIIELLKQTLAAQKQLPSPHQQTDEK